MRVGVGVSLEEHRMFLLVGQCAEYLDWISWRGIAVPRICLHRMAPLLCPAADPDTFRLRDHVRRITQICIHSRGFSGSA